MARLVELVIGGTTQPWQNLGIDTDHESFALSNVKIRCNNGAPGIHSWTIALDDPDTPTIQCSIDGIATTFVAQAPQSPLRSAIGDTEVVLLDHIVVNTSDIERTSKAIEDACGAQVRRVRDAGNGVMQAFHRLENTIIEVVSGPHISSETAQLWGIAISIEDLYGLAADLGDLASPPKAATQKGRFISTIRSAAGIGVPLAMMTPHNK